MEFDEAAKEILIPILLRRGFRLFAAYKNHYTLDSEYVMVRLGYDAREHSCVFGIGRNDIDFLVDNQILAKFIDPKLNINFLSIEDFTSKLSSLFSDEQSRLLIGDRLLFYEIISFQSEQSKRSYNKFIRQQYLNAADKAWELKDYQKFIASMQSLAEFEVPESYHLKYKIALKELQK